MEALTIKHTAKNFVEALKIVNLVGEKAEQHNHHPDIKLYGYKNIEFTLFTHDQGKVTDKDTTLAEEIKSILSDF